MSVNSIRGLKNKKRDVPVEVQEQEYRLLFDYFDNDHSGFIEIKELGNLMRALGHNPTDQDLADLINKVDVNNDKKIDFKEFKTLMNERKADSTDITDIEIIEAFRTFDKEGNGFLSRNDLKHIMTSLGEPISDKDADEILNVAEVDGDGQINYVDFFNKVNAATFI